MSEPLSLNPDAELPEQFSHCSDCGQLLQSDEEKEVGYCEQCIKMQADDDAAWRSEQRLRDMEGYGNYEGPTYWP
jgi:predicted amidophosphoribosyltransferase